MRTQLVYKHKVMAAPGLFRRSCRRHRQGAGGWRPSLGALWTPHHQPPKHQRSLQALERHTPSLASTAMQKPQPLPCSAVEREGETARAAQDRVMRGRAASSKGVTGTLRSMRLPYIEGILLWKHGMCSSNCFGTTCIAFVSQPAFCTLQSVSRLLHAYDCSRCRVCLALSAQG